MDIEDILDAAETGVPGLREPARRFLEAVDKARHLDVPLDADSVMARRAEGVPALHLTAAADQLLEHLAAIEGITLPEQGIIAVLAHAGAQLLVSGIELAGSPRAERA